MTTYSIIHTAVTAGKVMQTVGCFICYHNECYGPFRCLRQGTCLTQTVSSWASWWTARTWPTPMSQATWTPPRWGGRNTRRRCWDAFVSPFSMMKSAFPWFFAGGVRAKTLVTMIWGTYLVMKHQVQMGSRFYRKGKKGLQSALWQSGGRVKSSISIEQCPNRRGFHMTQGFLAGLSSD